MGSVSEAAGAHLLLYFVVSLIPSRNKSIGRKSSSAHPKAAFTLRNISASSHPTKVSDSSLKSVITL